LQDERGGDEAEVARIVNPYGDGLLSARLGFVRQPPRNAEAECVLRLGRHNVQRPALRDALELVLAALRKSQARASN
jgi:hypothetical protein